MKKVLLIALGVFVLLALLGAAFGESAEPASSTKPAKAEQKAAATDPADEARERAKNYMFTLYLEGCDPDGTETAYCVCTFNDMYDNLGHKEFVRAIEEYEETGALPPAMYQAAARCS